MPHGGLVSKQPKKKQLRQSLAALILGDEIAGMIRRELRKLSDGVLVESEEINKVLINEVLKRDVLEGEEATRAQSQVRKFYSKMGRRLKDVAPEKPSNISCDKAKKEVTSSDELPGASREKEDGEKQ